MNLEKEIRFKELKELSLDEFELKCSDVKNTLELRNEIINGCFYTIREVLSKEISDILLNMSLIQSHHFEDRFRAVGIDL